MDDVMKLATWLCEKLSAAQNISIEERGYCDDCLEDAQKFLADRPAPSGEAPRNVATNRRYGHKDDWAGRMTNEHISEEMERQYRADRPAPSGEAPRNVATNRRYGHKDDCKFGMENSGFCSCGKGFGEAKADALEIEVPFPGEEVNCPTCNLPTYNCCCAPSAPQVGEDDIARFEQWWLNIATDGTADVLDDFTLDQQAAIARFVKLAYLAGVRALATRTEAPMAPEGEMNMELNARTKKQIRMTPERERGLAKINQYLVENPEIAARNVAIGKGHEAIRDGETERHE